MTISRRSLLAGLPALALALMGRTRSEQVAEASVTVDAVPTTLYETGGGWERNTWTVGPVTFARTEEPNVVSVWLDGRWIGDVGGPFPGDQWWANTPPDADGMYTLSIGPDGLDDAIAWLRAEAGA